MRITRLTLYSVPIDVGMELTRYVATQKIDPSLHVLVVRVDTDTGLTGWGEVCSAPPYYLPELSAGAREGILYVAPVVLDRDPRSIAAILGDVSAALRGHGNAKTALEMALWDLCAKAHGLPLVDLWGGRIARDMPVLSVVRIGTQDEMLDAFQEQRARGYARFQVKLGAEDTHHDIETIRRVESLALPHERIWYDPNRAWLVDDAVRVIGATADLNPMIENPCETYGECRTVAQRTGCRMMLDEVLDSPLRFLEAVQDQVLDVASLKTSCIGGIEATRQTMGLARLHGVPLRIEDYYGSGLLLACVTHMAHTLPRKIVFGLYDFVSDDLPLVRNPLRVHGGTVRLPEDCGPGLGVDINVALLGNPVAERGT